MAAGRRIALGRDVLTSTLGSGAADCGAGCDSTGLGVGSEMLDGVLFSSRWEIGDVGFETGVVVLVGSGLTGVGVAAALGRAAEDANFVPKSRVGSLAT